MRSISVVYIVLLLTACAPREQDTPEFKAACEGPPLHNAEKREQAMVDGYQINRRYDCIDKTSFAAVAKAKAAWEAAQTPAALAKQEEEAARRKAYYQQSAREIDAEERAKPQLAPVTLHPVEINTASESELADVISIGAKTAAQIVAERRKARFHNWSDVSSRLVPLSAAQTVVFASICGLTVNGKSLDGFPPDGLQAAMIKKRYEAYGNR